MYIPIGLLIKKERETGRGQSFYKLPTDELSAASQSDEVVSPPRQHSTDVLGAEHVRLFQREEASIGLVQHGVTARHVLAACLLVGGSGGVVPG